MKNSGFQQFEISRNRFFLRGLVVFSVLLFLNVNGQGSDEITFTENKGQVHDQNFNSATDVLFSSQTGKLLCHFRHAGFSYQLTESTTLVADSLSSFNAWTTGAKRQPVHFNKIYRIDVELLHSNDHVEISGQHSLPDYENFYFANCPQGVINVKRYREIVYKNIYSGVDLRWYSKRGQLKYDYLVRAGADYRKIRFRIKGTTAAVINRNGDLELQTPLGKIIEQAPVVTQGGRTLKSCWQKVGDYFTFYISGAEKTKDLVIDPVVRIWATYYGGASGEYGVHVSTDAAGNVYLLGDASASTGTTIATSGAYQTTWVAPFADCFLAKFNSTGQRLWGTYYGGSQTEASTNAVTDASGNTYFTGYTQSANVMSSPGSHQTGPGGGSDAFLVKFNTSGVRIWGTYYGGSAVDYGAGLRLDNNGDLIFCGSSASPETGVIASAGAHQSQFAGGNQDGFLAKFSPNGTRYWGTYYGGTSNDIIYSCAVDASNNIYVGGNAPAYTGAFQTSQSTVIATPGAYQPMGNGGQDVFFVKFSTSGSRIWGSYYGGPGQELGAGVDLDQQGNIFLAGYCDATSTTGIATPGSHQAAFGGGPRDVFLVKFDPAGMRVWGSYYGGSGDEISAANHNLVLDPAGNVYLSGDCSSSNGTTIATPCSHQPVFGGGSFDCFLVKFNNNGVRQWGTYYGSNNLDGYDQITLDNAGNIYMSGTSNSAGAGTAIATAGSHQSAFGGASNNTGDAFLVKFIEASTSTISAGPIAGPASVCPSNTAVYSVSPVSGAASYSWTLPGGWTGSSASNTISVLVTGAGLFTLAPIDQCGTGLAQTFSVSLKPVPQLNISTSSKTVCTGQSVTLTVSGASTYTWSTAGTSNTVTLLPVSNTTITVSGTNSLGCVGSTVFTQFTKSCTGIGDLDQADDLLSIFPNPVRIHLNLFLSLSESCIYSIYSGDGRLVKQGILNNGLNVILCDELDAGIYFMSAANQTRKFVKMDN